MVLANLWWGSGVIAVAVSALSGLGLLVWERDRRPRKVTQVLTTLLVAGLVVITVDVLLVLYAASRFWEAL